jgi:hypothetical protein
MSEESFGIFSSASDRLLAVVIREARSQTPADSDRPVWLLLGHLVRSSPDYEPTTSGKHPQASTRRGGCITEASARLSGWAAMWVCRVVAKDLPKRT